MPSQLLSVQMLDDEVERVRAVIADLSAVVGDWPKQLVLVRKVAELTQESAAAMAGMKTARFAEFERGNVDGGDASLDELAGIVEFVKGAFDLVVGPDSDPDSVPFVADADDVGDLMAMDHGSGEPPTMPDGDHGGGLGFETWSPGMNGVDAVNVAKSEPHRKIFLKGLDLLVCQNRRGQLVVTIGGERLLGLSSAEDVWNAVDMGGMVAELWLSLNGGD